MTAYGYLKDDVTCGIVLGPILGANQILTPDVYCIGSAASLTGDLILNAVGDPSAIFIIKIDGALSTAANSRVILQGMASLCNVYWQINGKFGLGAGSQFKGTVLVNGEIELLEASSLMGQALSQAGAISTHNNVVMRGDRALADSILVEGPTSFCEGGMVVLSGNVNGVWNTGATTASISVSSSGDYFITNTNNCGVTSSNHIKVIVSPPDSPTITPNGPTTFCMGGSVMLTSSPAESYMWSTGATSQSITITSSGSYNVSVTTSGGCGDGTSADVDVTVNPEPIPTITASGPTTFCEGQSVTLTSSLGTSYLWSTGETTQSIMVDASGSYSVVTQNVFNCSSATTKVTAIPASFCAPIFIPTMSEYIIIMVMLLMLIMGVIFLKDKSTFIELK